MILRPQRPLFVSDLDGTLLRSDGTLSPRTVRLLNTALGQGVQFTVATARSPTKALSLLSQIHLRLPCVCANGAALVDPTTGEWLEQAAMDRGIVMSLIDWSVDRGMSPWLIGTQHGREQLQHSLPSNRFQRAFLAARAGEPRLTQCDSPTPLDETLVVVLVDSGERLATACASLQSQFGDTISLHLLSDPHHIGGATLEVSRSGTDKGSGVRTLCHRLNIASGDLIVFGDESNDLPMFRAAGTSVAVANATDLVKQKATARCGSNDEDGVPRFILEFLNIEGAA